MNSQPDPMPKPKPSPVPTGPPKTATAVTINAAVNGADRSPSYVAPASSSPGRLPRSRGLDVALSTAPRFPAPGADQPPIRPGG